jgi:hypothetical protein
MRVSDLVAPRALVPGGEHAAVILLGGEHLVARLEVEAVLGNLQRLAGIAVMAISSGSAPNSCAGRRVVSTFRSVCRGGRPA